jgi:hypothetical protein
MIIAPIFPPYIDSTRRLPEALRAPLLAGGQSTFWRMPSVSGRPRSEGLPARRTYPKVGAR